MRETDWIELRACLLDLGMEGDDPRGYLLSQGLESAVEMAEAMFPDDGEVCDAMVAYFAFLYLTGLRVGGGGGVDDGAHDGVAVSCARNRLNPAVLHVYVGVTIGALARMSPGLAIRREMDDGLGGRVLLTVFGGRSTEALTEQFLRLIAEIPTVGKETVH